MKILILFSDNMEDIEALGTRALLARAGFDVTSAAVSDMLDIRTAFGLKVKADIFVKNVKIDDFDALLIPGGPYVADVIERDKRYAALAVAFHQAGKHIAAICAAPRFLARAGLLDGKRFTAYPGSEKDAPKGKYRQKKQVVVDGTLITARGPGAVYDFALAVTTELLGRDESDKLSASILL